MVKIIFNGIKFCRLMSEKKSAKLVNEENYAEMNACNDYLGIVSPTLEDTDCLITALRGYTTRTF